MVQRINFDQLTNLGSVADPIQDQDAATQAFVNRTANSAATYVDGPDITVGATNAIVPSGSTTIFINGDVSSKITVNGKFYFVGDATVFTALTINFNAVSNVTSITFSPATTTSYAVNTTVIAFSVSRTKVTDLIAGQNVAFSTSTTAAGNPALTISSSNPVGVYVDAPNIVIGPITSTITAGSGVANFSGNITGILAVGGLFFFVSDLFTYTASQISFNSSTNITTVNFLPFAISTYPIGTTAVATSNARNFVSDLVSGDNISLTTSTNDIGNKVVTIASPGTTISSVSGSATASVLGPVFIPALVGATIVRTVGDKRALVPVGTKISFGTTYDIYTVTQIDWDGATTELVFYPSTTPATGDLSVGESIVYYPATSWPTKTIVAGSGINFSQASNVTTINSNPISTIEASNNLQTLGLLAASASVGNSIIALTGDLRFELLVGSVVKFSDATTYTVTNVLFDTVTYITITPSITATTGNQPIGATVFFYPILFAQNLTVLRAGAGIDFFGSGPVVTITSTGAATVSSVTGRQGVTVSPTTGAVVVSGAFATSAAVGVVKPGTGLSVDATGALTPNVATSTLVGVVKPGTGLAVDATGTLTPNVASVSGSNGVAATTTSGAVTVTGVAATSSAVGVVKPGTGMTVDNSGTLNANIATTSLLGVIKPDNITTFVDSNGVLSATGGGIIPFKPNVSIAYSRTSQPYYSTLTTSTFTWNITASGTITAIAINARDTSTNIQNITTATGTSGTGFLITGLTYSGSVTGNDSAGASSVVSVSGSVPAVSTFIPAFYFQPSSGNTPPDFTANASANLQTSGAALGSVITYNVSSSASNYGWIAIPDALTISNIYVRTQFGDFPFVADITSTNQVVSSQSFKVFGFTSFSTTTAVTLVIK